MFEKLRMLFSRLGDAAIIRSRKAFAPVIALVVAMVGIAVGLFIGLILNAQLYAVSENYDLGLVGNATRESLNSAINSAYSISTVIPYILVATIIIALVAGIATTRKG